MSNFQIFYSDDLTHIGTCESPYHKAGEPFHEEMIRADVDEVADAGADVHMLQPGLGWCPLWKRDVLPFAEHYAWVKDGREEFRMTTREQFVTGAALAAAQDAAGVSLFNFPCYRPHHERGDAITLVFIDLATTGRATTDSTTNGNSKR